MSNSILTLGVLIPWVGWADKVHCLGKIPKKVFLRLPRERCMYDFLLLKILCLQRCTVQELAKWDGCPPHFLVVRTQDY